LPFWSEERLRRLAGARDPLAIITARGVVVLPTAEQELIRRFAIVLIFDKQEWGARTHIHKLGLIPQIWHRFNVSKG
jgi:hypothetical protein